MKLAVFLAVAILITLAIMGSLGRWLLPQLSVQGSEQSVIVGAVSGALIVLLHTRMFQPDGS